MRKTPTTLADTQRASEQFQANLAAAHQAAMTANLAHHAHELAESFVRRVQEDLPLELQWAGLMSVRDTLPTLLSFAISEGLHIGYLLDGILTASERLLGRVMASDAYDNENKSKVVADCGLVLSFIRDYLTAVEA